MCVRGERHFCPSRSTSFGTTSVPGCIRVTLCSIPYLILQIDLGYETWELCGHGSYHATDGPTGEIAEIPLLGIWPNSQRTGSHLTIRCQAIMNNRFGLNAVHRRARLPLVVGGSHDAGF